MTNMTNTITLRYTNTIQTLLGKRTNCPTLTTMSTIYSTKVLKFEMSPILQLQNIDVRYDVQKWRTLKSLKCSKKCLQ
jgi:hypothetical protein